MARTVPTTTYEAPGNLVTAELWNLGPKVLNDFLSNRPAFVSRANLNQSIPNNTWTAIQFALDLLDTDSGHNTVINNTRFVCQVPGWYWARGSVSINPTGVGNGVARMDTAIARNGSIIAGSAQFLTKGANVNAAQQASTMIHLAAGQYAELLFRQNTGITINTDLGFDIETGFSVFWVRAY